MSDTKMPEHTPPMFLVRDPNANPEFETEYYDFNLGEQDKALAKARELAAANPGKVIDIYQHVTGVRKSE